MQEICRGWGETPVSKRAEVQEKGRERLEMAMWARHPLTGEWEGRRDGAKESRTAAHSKKVSASTMERLGARVAHESFPASRRNGHEEFIRCAESRAGSSPGEGAVLETEEAVTEALPDLCSCWRVFTVTANTSAGNDKERRWPLSLGIAMSLLKRKYSIINDLPSPSSSTGLQQRISLVGEVGPVLIKFYQLREREERLTPFLLLHLLLKVSLELYCCC